MIDPKRVSLDLATVDSNLTFIFSSRFFFHMDVGASSAVHLYLSEKVK